MQVVLHAMKELNSKKETISSETLRGEISVNTDFNGVSGNFSFDKNGDAIKSMRLMTVRNGEFITIER